MSQVAAPTPLNEELIKLRREGEERAAKRLGGELGYPYVDIGKTPASFEAVTAIPEPQAREALAVGLERGDRTLAVAVADPRLPPTLRLLVELRKQFPALKVVIASRSGIAQLWHMYSFSVKEAKGITGKVEFEARLAELMRKLPNFRAVKEAFGALDFAKESTTDFLEMLLAGALANEASDVHCEAEEEQAKFRFRIDGRLHDVATNIPLKNYEALLARFKLLAGLKINVRDEAQDGRFTVRAASDKEIEIRVSIVPSEFGETVVMRILDPKEIILTFADLGLREDDLVIVNAELAKPNGLILNTGPTGSGKTTTLYAFLRKLNDPEVKIITVEDPIEYRVEGIEQTQVDAEAGYTFASGLRAIVRQDPDVVLVGEIRDTETADIALQAALTGHLVLSTLHTNDAVGAVPRLTNLGVKPATIGAAVSLVIAQRLVRKLCEKCKKEVPLTPETEAHIASFLKRIPSRVDRAPYAHPTLFEPAGCGACNHFGYKGRIGIFEFFRGGLELEEVILQEVAETVLVQLAVKQGMVRMQEDGVLKALRGLTSLKEVEEVTGPLEWQSTGI
ncbi:MAG: type II/IV secretion system protein [Candidatus Liptonbacteria bacterium]|nr:type II/IV secretion system protein [Candidatus Liptonbacteria bacterium]